jgi:hypothetical protein
MKRALLLLAIALCVAAVVLAAPDFSGTWARNAEKTAVANPAPAGGGGGGGGGRGGGGGMGGGEMVIKMTGTEMSITQGQNESKYVLDAAEHTVTTGRGDLKYKATWSGDVLTIAGTQSSQRGDSPYKMQYSMSADGKELTTTQTMNMQGQEMVRKTIYDKK